MHDSVAHSQMKGTFSTSSYLPAAVAIFSFASLNVESLRAILSSLDCMPKLVLLAVYAQTFIPRPGPPALKGPGPFAPSPIDLHRHFRTPVNTGWRRRTNGGAGRFL